MTTINRALLWFTSVVTAIITGALVLLVITNVAARYLFETGILWAEEMSRLLFVWVVFLGAYIALCRKGHMAIVMVIDRLPVHIRKATELGGLVLVFAFLSVVTFAGFRLAIATYGFGRVTPILGISAAWAYLSVPVAGLLMMLETIGQIVDAWRRPPDSHVADPLLAELAP